ncbi:MAG: type 2 lanthipeptide synthetase LanM [Thermoanaerobaculia bacterium]
MRVESALAEPPPPPEFNADLLAGWARAFSGGDLAALERRLSWDGLDLALAARAVGSGRRFTGEPLPEWLELAARRFPLGEDARPEARPRRGLVTGLDLAVVPFGELWAPVVEAALAEAADQIDAALAPRRDLATLAGALALDIGAAGSRAAHERYLRARGDDSAPGAYRRYVESELSSGFLEFALEFPVAVRQVARLVDTWIAALVELAQRIERDRTAVAESFAGGRDLGAVVEVSQPRSDRHNGGRGIFRVRFADGTDLVVKPRSLAIEVAWERLLSRLAELGFEELPPAARALDLGTHGWMEWIAAEELADAASADGWFRSAGALVALAELLGAEDLHAENLVAGRRGPVVVDAEMMAQPDRPGVDARQRFTGGLLRRGSAATGRIANWAGLHPVEPRAVTAQALHWRGLGGDGIEPVAGERITSPLPNAPLLGGRQLAPTEHAAALLLGHRRTWERLLASRPELLRVDGPLAVLAGVSTRLLFRPSQEYASVLDLLRTPRWQRQGTSPGILLEALARPFATAERAPQAWPLVVVERAMLEALDVPRFEVGADRLVVEHWGAQAEGLIVRSTRAAIAGRLAALSVEEIHRLAEELAVALHVPAGPRISLEPAEGADSRARALALANRLAAFERDRGTLGRSRATESAGSLDRRLRELALYDGEIGRALVLAMADRLDGGDRYLGVGEELTAALDRFADDNSLAELPIGGLEGAGAVVWGLVALASLRSPRSDESAALLERAGRFAERIGRSGAAPAAVHDLHGGTAGALVALLALAEATQEEVWCQRAVELGDQLLAAGTPASGGGIAWTGDAGEPALTGFAHGSTGIARALSALWKATGASRFALAVGGALAFEGSRFDARLGDWPVVRPGVAESEERRVAMNAYCHGGAGIALGRALLAPELRNEPFDAEVDVAVSATVRAGMGDFDHLCCGAAGRLAILGEVGLRLGRTDALAASRRGLEALLARTLRLPDSSRAQPEVEAGLFRGVAGVAWVGLFAASADDPAVLDPLVLELPSEARARAGLARANKGDARKSAAPMNREAR